jgi:NAD-dependent dihydropyrimidine dehydrogenase PreA subunit
VAQNKKQKIADYFVLNWRVLSKPIFYLLFNIYDGVKKLVAIVDTSKCTGCETCVDECPASAIALENEKAKVDKDLCVDCQTCVDVCPSEAILVE